MKIKDEQTGSLDFADLELGQMFLDIDGDLCQRTDPLNGKFNAVLFSEVGSYSMCFDGNDKVIPVKVEIVVTK